MRQVTTPAIKQIEEMVEGIPGWTPLDQLYTLFNLVYGTAGMKGDVVEIGSWCGRSSSVLAMAAQLTGDTRLHCIDLFPAKDDWSENADGSFSFSVTIGDTRYGGYQEQTAWKEPYERDIKPIYERWPSVFDAFNEAITANGFRDIVEAHRGDSSFCAELAARGVTCRVAFIDADHSYAAVCKDITNVELLLLEGGWICFDDAFSSYEGVNRAIEDRIINSSDYELPQQMTRKLFVARRVRRPARGR